MDEINLQNVIQCEQTEVKVILEETERSKRRNQNGSNLNTGDNQHSYTANRNIAEGMMDLALLTANANQLRFLINYNSMSPTFYISVGLIISSLVLQVALGIALIFRRKNDKKSRMLRTNQFLVGGVFMVTFINILVAAFTSTDKTNVN